MVQAAKYDVNQWTTCRTCNQHWTGEMEVALARARWASVRDRLPEDAERLFVANNLAVTLQESAGDSEGAAQLLKEVLAVRRRTLGNEHSETLDSITNLALHYMEVGDCDAALPLSEEAVALTRRSLEPGAADDDQEAAAHAIGSLAAVLHLKGEHARAKPLHEEALDIRLRLLGPSHLDSMNSCHGLGQCLVALGDRRNGLAMLEELAARARLVLGESHPSTMHFARGRAEALSGQRDALRGNKPRRRV